MQQGMSAVRGRWVASGVYRLATRIDARDKKQRLPACWQIPAAAGGRMKPGIQVGVNNPLRAVSVIAATAGCLMRRSAEMA